MADIEISHSRLQAYENCPWKYHLVYEENWRSGPKAPAALGQSLHRTLDAFLSKENEDRSLDRLMECFDQVWVNEGFGSPQETMEAYERGRSMLEKFFEIDSSRTSEIVATEKEFMVEIEPGVKLRGTIDRLDKRADGSFEVIEYKTNGEAWTDARVAEDRQMTLYALGLGQELKKPIKLTYYFLSLGKSAGTTRSAEQLEEARTRVVDVAAKIRQREFSPNQAHCNRCEFGRRCANFKP